MEGTSEEHSINWISYESTNRSQGIGNPELNSSNTILAFEKPKMWEASIILLHLGLWIVPQMQVQPMQKLYNTKSR